MTYCLVRDCDNTYRLPVTEKRDGFYYANPLYILDDRDLHDRIKSWADAMNYLDGKRGYTYYNGWDEVLEDYIDIWEQEFDEDEPTPKPTMEDIKKIIEDWQVAEACDGEIEFIDEDEE